MANCELEGVNAFSLMEKLVARVQNKIGAYDKQLWEESVEERVLKSIEQVPKKNARVKAELIDVDLVKGSTFTKAKPQHGWLAVFRAGLVRLFLLPVYLKWWENQTTRWFTALILLLYFLQVGSTVVYFTDTANVISEEGLSLAHLTSPWILTVVLGLMHAQIVATRLSHKHHFKPKEKRPNKKTDKKKRKVRYRVNASEQNSTSQETGADTHIEEDSSSSREHQHAHIPPSSTAATNTESSTAAQHAQDTSKQDLFHEAAKPKVFATKSMLNSTPSPDSPKYSTVHDDLIGDDAVEDSIENIMKVSETVASRAMPVTDFSFTGDTLRASSRPKEATSLRKASKKNAFQPAIIVHTDGEGAATNEESDSEISIPHREPDITLRRRRRPCNLSQETGNKYSSKKTNLTVKVTDPKESTGLSSGDSEQETVPNTPSSLKGQTSEYDWDDTMNSDVTSSETTSCTSGSDSSDMEGREDPFHTTHLHTSSSVMNNLASTSDKVSCMIWEDDQVKKVDLTVLDIGWTIIQRVDQISQMCDCVMLGMFFALIICVMPLVFRAYTSRVEWPQELHTFQQAAKLCTLVLGSHWRTQWIVLNGAIQRFSLSVIFFFLLSVADRTFKQRLLYAKNFCYLTSSRRAKKYELPHFRLNKVRNIKTWLSLRSYLKKRGPQRSINTIVSVSFILAVVLVSLMCLKLLQDSGGFLDNLSNWELVCWCMALAIYLLRFMTIGTKINRKYRNFSILITEKINLYLHMEKKPHKKEELMLANNVLKLAEDLLKELESPFKISGLSANPFLYNITKVIVLSAFSAVLTELLGFKLKLYKIKIRP